MTLIVCVDDKGGMLFNRRRQSQDRQLRADLLHETGGGTLWMNEYSARQFGPLPENVRVSEDCLTQAGPGEFCFAENQDLSELTPEGLIVYRWNRVYPADLYFPLSLEGRTLVRREEFAGSSHEKITKEVYA